MVFYVKSSSSSSNSSSNSSSSSFQTHKTLNYNKTLNHTKVFRVTKKTQGMHSFGRGRDNDFIKTTFLTTVSSCTNSVRVMIANETTTIKRAIITY